MLHDIVPIGPWHEPIHAPYLAGMSIVFPYANDFLPDTGCIPYEQSHARVKYCPACRAAKAVWFSGPIARE
jgi:hypothetical protein